MLLSLIKKNGTLSSIIVLFCINAILTPNFFHLQTLYINLTQVSTIAIVAIGMTLVIATKGIDLSVGAIMALSGTLASLMLKYSFGFNSQFIECLIAISIALLGAGLCGWLNGFLIGKFKIQPIVASLILFITVRGIAQALTNGQIQTIDHDYFEFIGTGRLFGIPFQSIIVLVIILLFAFVVKRTVYGRYILAIGGNDTAAELSGIPVKKVKIMTYIICAVLAGIAGLITTAINSASDANQNGQLMELDAIAAAVVGGAILNGGRAPIVGAFLGAAVIQLMGYTLLANGVHDAVAMVIKAVIIILAVFFQQKGKAY